MILGSPFLAPFSSDSGFSERPPRDELLLLDLSPEERRCLDLLRLRDRRLLDRRDVRFLLEPRCLEREREPRCLERERLREGDAMDLNVMVLDNFFYLVTKGWVNHKLMDG